MKFLNGNAGKSKYLKMILVALAFVILATSGIAAWRFFFYEGSYEPGYDPGEEFTLSDADTALFQAVRGGAVDEVLRCLSEGGNVHAVGEYGVTPFRIAIALDRVDVVQEFVRAERGGVADKWNSLLVYAIIQNRPRIVGELISLAPSVNLPDGNGYTPLLYAINRNNLTVTQELLNAGVDVNAPGRDGVTPLIAAVRRGKPEMVAELLKAGADWKVPSPSGETAITIARKSVLREVIASLLAEAEAPAETMTYEKYMDYTLFEDVDSETEVSST